MLLRICDAYHQSIVYGTNNLMGECPVCHLHKMLDDAGNEIKILKARILELEKEKVKRRVDIG